MAVMCRRTDCEHLGDYDYCQYVPYGIELDEEGTCMNYQPKRKKNE